jgi:hypothetical protein
LTKAFAVSFDPIVHMSLLMRLGTIPGWAMVIIDYNQIAIAITANG